MVVFYSRCCAACTMHHLQVSVVPDIKAVSVLDTFMCLTRAVDMPFRIVLLCNKELFYGLHNILLTMFDKLGCFAVMMNHC